MGKTSSRGASLRDVARLAKVSTATASRILNNDTSFSAETRRRVLAAVAQLNYVPKLSYRNALKHFSGRLAKGRTRRTNNIALLGRKGWFLDPAAYVFHGETRDEITVAAQEFGFSLLVTVVPDEAVIPDMILEEKADAAILRFVPERDFLRRLRAHVPVLLLGFPGEELNVSSVCVNEHGAFRLAFKHLYDLGHRDIAYFHSSREERYEIAMSVMRELGLQILPEWTEPIPHDLATVDNAIQRALELYESGPRRPTAVVTYEFPVGIHMFYQLRMRGIRFPEDMSFVVIGDNLRIMEGGDIQWTAVRYPMIEMGRWAVEEAVRMVEDPNRPIQHLKIEGRLIKRASSGPPPSR